VEFSIKQSSPEKQRSGCVVIGVYEGGKLSTAAQLLDKAAAHHLSDLIARGDMNGKVGSLLMLHHVANIVAERVLMVGLGKANEFAAKQLLDVLRATLGALQKTACKDAALYLTDLPVKGRDEAWKIMQTGADRCRIRLPVRPTQEQTCRCVDSAQNPAGLCRQTRQLLLKQRSAKPLLSHTA